MQSKQFLSSSLPFTVSLFVLLYERVECPNWVTGQRLDSWQVQWARVNTSLYIACFFFSLFFPDRSDQHFPSISSDSPPFYLHFCIQEFYYRVRAFVSLVCMVFHAWHVGTERPLFFFSLSFPPMRRPERNGIVWERVCVKHFQILWGILVLIKHHFFG